MTCSGAIHDDGRITHDGDTCPIHEDRLLCIGTARGIKGNVYAADGTLIGYVFKQSRRLRSTGGQFGEAWTANIILPDGSKVAGSLGTRYRDRFHAARAIRAFWAAYPPQRIATMAEAERPELRRWYPNYSAADLAMHSYHAAAGYAVSLFKYDEYETCGLLARYRGADPRSYRRTAA